MITANEFNPAAVPAAAEVAEVAQAEVAQAEVAAVAPLAAAEVSAAARNWVAVLRSTQAIQGRYALLNDTPDGKAYCCLGIACDISGIGVWGWLDGKTWLDGKEEYAYLTSGKHRVGADGMPVDFGPTGSLPIRVADRLGIRTSLGDFWVTSEWVAALHSEYPDTARKVDAYLASGAWLPRQYHTAATKPDNAPDGARGAASLSALNDFGLTFAEVADVIESNPPGLFGLPVD